MLFRSYVTAFKKIYMSKLIKIRRPQVNELSSRLIVLNMSNFSFYYFELFFKKNTKIIKLRVQRV